MTGINIATKLFVITIVIIVGEISPCAPAISDRRLCFDKLCSVQISTASTVMTYGSNDPDIMSFKSNADVKVFSKSAGTRQDLWGVEIDGKRGYVPMNLLREKRVYKKALIHEVPTESVVSKNADDVPKNIETDDDNTVPNDSSETGNSEDSVKKLANDSAEKIDENLAESGSSTSPLVDGVSPSYEIHDGTTITLVENDETSEPSYATKISQSASKIMEQQPIMTIHPSIASTFAFDSKMRDNDVGRHLENFESKEKSSDVKIGEKPTNELPSEIRTDSPDSSSNGDEKIVHAIDKSDVSSDRENSDEPKADNRKTIVENSIEITPTEINTVELKNENNANNATERKTNFSHDGVDDKISDGVENEATENSVVSHENQNATVETAAEVSTMKLTAETTKTEQIVDNPDNFVAAMNDKNDTSKIEIAKIADGNSETADVIADDEEKIDSEDDDAEEGNDDEAEDDDENDENDDAPEIVETPDKMENNVPTDETSTEKSVEPAKSSEDSVSPPKPQNIMSPLFSRLSSIPNVVKGFVSKTLSSTDSDVETISDEKNPSILKPEVKNSNVDEISKTDETKISSVDSSTDFNSETDAKNADMNNLENEFANKNDSVGNDIAVDGAPTETTEELSLEEPVEPGILKQDETTGFRQDGSVADVSSSFNGFPANRNLLNVGSGLQANDRHHDEEKITNDVVVENHFETVFNNTESVNKSLDESLNKSSEESVNKSLENSSEMFAINEQTEINDAMEDNEASTEAQSNDDAAETVDEPTADDSYTEEATVHETLDSCQLDNGCDNPEGDEENHNFFHKETEDEQIDEKTEIAESFTIGRNYWETLSYLVITALTTLIFSLGYYYIENTRRDGQLIAKINILEKELLVASKECMVLDDTLKSTKTKLDSIEDESFGSNEMVVSLKNDLETVQAAKSELEDQVTMLEKELETATEAGLELERMLREILSTNNQDNPLAQSVEDLQTRLNAQQAANEALTNAMNLKAQENESLTADLATMTQKCEQLEVEVTRVTEELKHQNNVKSNLEQNLLDKLSQLESQVKDIAAERSSLRKQLKVKDAELKDLREVVDQMNVNNLDFEKLYNVSRIKAEASQLIEERDELQMTLSEVEGAHQLLEEHTRLISEEVVSLSEQCKLAEKAKRDAETRVEVLSNFFKEKEAQRQKEEAVWLQKQGEVSSTVERLHTMQNEIHNYKQQIEMLKREIVDQEREYKSQIANLETKTHEHWVIARQNERRLEESKAEAGQLRNRLTLIEKNLNDTDPEAKLHRLEVNGETATSPQLFIGAEASSSPIMFTGSSGVPYPPPSSYRYCPPPPFMPPPTYAPPGLPPYDVGQRPPPLGGRLSSPPPLPGPTSGRYDDPRSPLPPLSPPILPPFPGPHRGYPPPFANDRVHPPPPPPTHSSMLPPPPPPPLGPSSHSWTNETLPPLRNSGFRGHHQHQHRDQRPRNHKGSLHSSGESLDKTV